MFRRLSLTLTALLVLEVLSAPVAAHVVPPEQLHPVAASYRRLEFTLNLNPVRWDLVADDLEAMTSSLGGFDSKAARELGKTQALLAAETGDLPLEQNARRALAHEVLSAATRTVAAAIRDQLVGARGNLADYASAARHLETARDMYAAFEPAIEVAEPEEFIRIGECWLELTSSLGHPGLQGIGKQAANTEVFTEESAEVIEYLETNFTDGLKIPKIGRLAPLPGVTRDAYPPGKRLPPGFDINKQIPRPRQILNMAVRGVDESETTLIALGDMAFDTALIFGEPARSLAITCNTCHNKGVTNPNFFIPGLSSRPGGMDVSNSFFGAHANNGVFDALDIPDLRGLRFTAPYGRNGRFGSLREFTRNVIVNEFSGPEPEPLLLDGLVAYMLEFDFLPTPQLNPDGTLSDRASAEARRGEAIFNRPLRKMGGRSCATCHVPSDHFLDRKRHDIGSVAGAEADSRDRALDTPTLLGVLYTAPYFHDGRFETLGQVVEWFEQSFDLGLSNRERTDLTAYLETIGDGTEAYEDTFYTLTSELEEFYFFLSAYEYLKEQGETDLIDITFGTIAFEIRAHKWDVQDPANLPKLDRLAALMDQARETLAKGDLAATNELVADYREYYQAHADILE